jgi:hypothetical protein
MGWVMASAVAVAAVILWVVVRPRTVPELSR